MTDRTISPTGGPLRRRMTEDMTVRGFTASTQRGYIRAVGDFTAFFGRSPDSASAEDLRRYQLHMRSSGASATTMNAAVSALRFFFGVTLGRDDANQGMTTVREPSKLPVVLSPEEVARLLDAAPGLKYRAFPRESIGQVLLFGDRLTSADDRVVRVVVGLVAFHVGGVGHLPKGPSAFASTRQGGSSKPRGYPLPGGRDKIVPLVKEAVKFVESTAVGMVMGRSPQVPLAQESRDVSRLLQFFRQRSLPDRKPHRGIFVLRAGGIIFMSEACPVAAREQARA